MWIFLGIVAFLAAVITAILLSPVDVILKSDPSGDIQLRYRWLFKTYGEDPNPNSPVLKTLKRATGTDRLEKKQLQQNMREEGLGDTVEQTVRVLWDLLREVVSLLRYCTAKKFLVRIMCAEEEAADTAITYGRCCAVVYPLVGFISSILKVRERGQSIDISCDYLSGQEDFDLHLLISVRFFRVLAAFFRVAFKEAERTVEQETLAQSAAAPRRKPPQAR